MAAGVATGLTALCLYLYLGAASPVEEEDSTQKTPEKPQVASEEDQKAFEEEDQQDIEEIKKMLLEELK